MQAKSNKILIDSTSKIRITIASSRLWSSSETEGDNFSEEQSVGSSLLSRAALRNRLELRETSQHAYLAHTCRLFMAEFPNVDVVLELSKVHLYPIEHTLRAFS